MDLKKRIEAYSNTIPGRANAKHKREISELHIIKFPLVQPKDWLKSQQKISRRTEKRLRRLTSGSEKDPHRRSNKQEPSSDISLT